mmetsp:Transcript_18944/g.31422  ORF Transcript_18944/g.31422 Transcript_18944/m.31422 type:complete len:90 (-) Transcript_18944:275-544(-)
MAKYFSQVFSVVDVNPLVAWNGNAEMGLLSTKKATTSLSKSISKGYPCMTDLSCKLRDRLVRECFRHARSLTAVFEEAWERRNLKWRCC